MKEAAERRLEELKKQLEQAKANINALAGAVAVLEDLLSPPAETPDEPTPTE